MAADRPDNLVIGFGNPFRRDDGVALEVINRFRREDGLPPLGLDEDGTDLPGKTADTWMLHQLLPELAGALAGYRRVVFLDAHLGRIPEEVRVVPVDEEYSLQAMTHHLSPGMLLSLTRLAGGAAPQGWLISIRGEDFGYGEGLSPTCRANAAEAAHRLHALLANEIGTK